MKALVLNEVDSFPSLMEFPDPVKSDNQKILDLKAAALNHRDVWITKGKYPSIKFPIVLGSDGVGVIDDKFYVVQPGINWGKNERFQSKNYEVLGMPQNGTFAELIAVYPAQVFPNPPHLDAIQAAALPLAGLTAYRVLFTRCQAKAGEKVLITGIGGGVALTCMQFAIAQGLTVFVTSSSNEKISKAVALGAHGGANYENENWHKELETLSGGGFDIIVDSAGGESFRHLVKLCAPGGRIGIYGGTKGTLDSLSPQIIFWRQISILGSTMGSDKDFTEMLSFVERHKIVPVIDSVYKMDEAAEAFKRLERGRQFGKVVIDIAT